MAAFGKIFIILGIVFVLVGLACLFGHKLPFIGRLPGDIVIKKENFSLYFPLGTSILLSILLTVIFSLFRK